MYEEEGHFRMELEHLAQSDTSDQHPIQINGIDVCEIEHSISSSDKLIRSKLYDYGLNELKAIVAGIQKEFPGKRASMQKAATIIAKGEFFSNHNEIYNSPPILFDITESFTETCKQSLFTALSKRLNWVKYNGR